MQGADLTGADLWNADLRCVNLENANLTGVYLLDADLRRTKWHGLIIDGLPSHQIMLIPTPEGWDLRIGVWNGTPKQLLELDGWPGATGEEIARRQPRLESILALCEVHMADYEEYATKLKENWA